MSARGVDDDETGPDAAIESAGRVRSARGPIVLVLVGLTALALAFAVWMTVRYLSVRGDEDLEFAAVREEVARVAQEEIKTFHSLDYRKVDEGLDRWVNASTGSLRDEVNARRETSKKAIEQARTITEASILSDQGSGRLGFAVNELNVREGTATVMAGVKVMVTEEGKDPVPKQMRILATLQRTDAGWKLNAIQQMQFAPAS